MKSYVNLVSEHVHSRILNKLIQDQLGNNPIASGLTASCNSWRLEHCVMPLLLEIVLISSTKREEGGNLASYPGSQSLACFCTQCQDMEIIIP